MTVKKHLRAQEVALHNRLPCIYLVDSGGAYLPLQDEIFPDRERFGRTFFNQATMSAADIAQIAAVMGSCTAGGAYVPAMSDETVIVHEQGTIFLGGPPLVKAATGEEVTAEELGGGQLHAAARGVIDHLAGDDLEALRDGALDHLDVRPAGCRAVGARESEDPVGGPRPSCYGAVPTGAAHRLRPARADRACWSTASASASSRRCTRETMVCGFARVHGHPVGMVANHGVLFAESARKAAHFVALCDQRGVPLLFLQNITGFHGRARRRGRRDRPRRGEDGLGGRLRAGAEAHGHRRRLPTARATTGCAGARTAPAFSGRGPTRGSR